MEIIGVANSPYGAVRSECSGYVFVIRRAVDAADFVIVIVVQWTEEAKTDGHRSARSDEVVFPLRVVVRQACILTRIVPACHVGRVEGGLRRLRGSDSRALGFLGRGRAAARQAGGEVAQAAGAGLEVAETVEGLVEGGHGLGQTLLLVGEEDG